MKFLFKNRGQDNDPSKESEESPEKVEDSNVAEDIDPQEPLLENVGPALPEAPETAQPRLLIAGSFLHDRWEVLEAVRRGTVNFYAVADERMLHAQSVQLAQQQRDDDCFVEQLASALWQPIDIFTQDDCDYAVFAGGDFRPLSDWRAAPRDEFYLGILHELAQGLLEWREKGLAPAVDGVWGADVNHQLRYYGFLKQEPQGQQDDYDEMLRDINLQLLKQVFASSATMRLGDAWSALPFCEETIGLIRDIQENTLSLDEAVRRLESLSPAKVLLRDVALQTDPGQERELNEDSGAVLHLQNVGEGRQQDVDLWVVADGMGGHESGEVASHLAVTTLQQQLLERLPDLDLANNAQVRQALFEIAQQVNAEVYALGAVMHTRTPPGTTLVAALRVGRRLFVINVGDSRAYLWSANEGLRRISRDHSYVQDLLDRGEITPEEVFGHPQGNIITSNIGMKRLEKCDIYLRLAQPGDKLLLVSDGVVDMLHEPQIADIIAANDAVAVCQNLVDEANNAGGVDNITALAVHFTTPAEPTTDTVGQEEPTEIH